MDSELLVSFLVLSEELHWLFGSEGGLDLETASQMALT